MSAGAVVCQLHFQAKGSEMASRRRDLGALSPRLLELSAKTTPIEPYKITDKVQIRQTRKRRDDLHDAYNEIVAAQSKVAKLQRRARDLSVPEHPGDDATEEQIAAYEAAAAEMRRLQESLEAELAEINSAADAAVENYNRSFFGDAYEDVMELTADESPEFFDLLVADINEHFSRGVNPPPDGRDDDGNVVDVAEAVEAGKSST